MNSIRQYLWEWGYFYLKVNKKTENTLARMSNEIKSALQEEDIFFVPKQNNFHVTLEWNKATDENTIKKLLSEFNLKLGEIHSKNEWGEVNFLNPNIHYDETFHKIWILESNINWKLFCILTPHKDETLLKDLKMTWKIHLSVGSFTQKLTPNQLRTTIWVIKESRDLYLNSTAFILDWSQVHWKEIKKTQTNY